MTLPQTCAAILGFQETKQLANMHFYENGGPLGQYFEFWDASCST